jgi:hypothetical protein
LQPLGLDSQMSQPSTQPDNLHKLVFENVRNLLSFVSMIMLGVAVQRFHQHLGMVRWFAVVLAVLLTLLLTVLLIWNAVVGFRELIALRQWPLVALLAGVYLVIVILLLHAVPALLSV